MRYISNLFEVGLFFMEMKFELSLLSKSTVLLKKSDFNMVMSFWKFKFRLTGFFCSSTGSASLILHIQEVSSSFCRWFSGSEQHSFSSLQQPQSLHSVLPFVILHCVSCAVDNGYNARIKINNSMNTLNMFLMYVLISLTNITFNLIILCIIYYWKHTLKVPFTFFWIFKNIY